MVVVPSFFRGQGMERPDALATRCRDDVGFVLVEDDDGTTAGDEGSSSRTTRE